MNNELKHYGVIGMRWGVRKARRKGETYTYKSHGQKKYEAKLDRQKLKGVSENRLSRTRNKLETFQRRDANRQKYAESTTVGRSVVKGILMGPFGSGNYNRMRASGSTRLGAALASNWISSTLSLPYQILATRDAEFRSARR